MHWKRIRKISARLFKIKVIVEESTKDGIFILTSITFSISFEVSCYFTTLRDSPGHQNIETRIVTKHFEIELKVKA